MHAMSFEQIAGLVAMAILVIAAFWMFWPKSPKPRGYYESGIGMQEPRDRHESQGKDFL